MSRRIEDRYRQCVDALMTRLQNDVKTCYEVHGECAGPYAYQVLSGWFSLLSDLVEDAAILNPLQDVIISLYYAHIAPRDPNMVCFAQSAAGELRELNNQATIVKLAIKQAIENHPPAYRPRVARGFIDAASPYIDNKKISKLQYAVTIYKYAEEHMDGFASATFQKIYEWATKQEDLKETMAEIPSQSAFERNYRRWKSQQGVSCKEKTGRSVVNAGDVEESYYKPRDE